MAMVMPRSRSSGALSIESNARYSALPFSARYFEIAAVRLVLPWSMWPIVPMLTCGLVRSNFFLATRPFHSLQARLRRIVLDQDPGTARDGAHNRTRTDDLFLTKEVLCRLSYVGPGPLAGCVVGREGIEPPQSKTADLQSAELTTCSTYPLCETAGRDCGPVVNPPPEGLALGADDGTRTRNRRFTKPLLYQLSYVGAAQGHTAEGPFGAEE